MPIVCAVSKNEMSFELLIYAIARVKEFVSHDVCNDICPKYRRDGTASFTTLCQDLLQRPLLNLEFEPRICRPKGLLARAMENPTPQHIIGMTGVNVDGPYLRNIGLVH